MKPPISQSGSNAPSWNERVLMIAVVVTMVLSLLGYMHG